MPIIDINVQSALRKAGLLPKAEGEGDDIQSRLDRNGLSQDELLVHLQDLVEGADTSAVKLRAIDTALKMHGVLKDQTPPPPAVNIIIHDDKANAEFKGGINPILIPRKTAVQ